MFISSTWFSGNLLTRHANLSDTVALRHAPHFSSAGKAQTDIFEPVHRNTLNQPLFGVHEPLKGHGVPRDPDPEEVRRRQEEIAAEMRRRDEETQRTQRQGIPLFFSALLSGRIAQNSDDFFDHG